MMRTISIVGIVVAGVLVHGTVARAQEPLALTVEEAVTRAVAEAPRLSEARARQAAADAAVTARTALGRPLVTTTAGILRTNHVDPYGVLQPGGTVAVIFPDIPTNYRARAEVTLPIYTAGRVDGLVASAGADRRAADADRRSVEADVRLETVMVYFGLLMARESVRVLERAMERADESLETVRARVDTGLLPPSDALSAEAQRARQNVQLIRARNDAALAEADLGRLVGVDPGRSIVLTTPVDQPLKEAAGVATMAADALAERARTNRSERQALVDREAGLRTAASVALSATRPQVSVLAAIEPARPSPRWVPRTDQWRMGWDLGVSATWALWDGGRARAEHTGAMAQADALRHQMDAFDAVIGVEARQRLLDLSATQAALAASTEAVAAAAEARRVLGERFLVGIATNSEVLDADVDLLEAELERARILAAIRVSEARLLRTAGDR